MCVVNIKSVSTAYVFFCEVKYRFPPVPPVFVRVTIIVYTVYTDTSVGSPGGRTPGVHVAYKKEGGEERKKGEKGGGGEKGEKRKRGKIISQYSIKFGINYIVVFVVMSSMMYRYKNTRRIIYITTYNHNEEGHKIKNPSTYSARKSRTVCFNANQSQL